MDSLDLISHQVWTWSYDISTIKIHSASKATWMHTHTHSTTKQNGYRREERYLMRFKKTWFYSSRITRISLKRIQAQLLKLKL